VGLLSVVGFDFGLGQTALGNQKTAALVFVNVEHRKEAARKCFDAVVG
jgi:hypothetical protein